jgi:uncharacterized protein
MTGGADTCEAEVVRRLNDHLELMSTSDLELLAEVITAKIAGACFRKTTKLELFLTDSCNLCCDYCFVPHKNCGGRMPWEVAKAAVDLLFREAEQQQGVRIIYFGGEPLLEADLILKVMEYANRRAREVGIGVEHDTTVNGTLMDNEIARDLCGLGMRVMMSVDGDERSHDKHRKTPVGKGSFAAAISGYEALRKEQQWIGTKMTVSPDTVGDLASNVRYLSRLGFQQFICGVDTQASWSVEKVETYREQIHKVAHYYMRTLKAGQCIRITDFEVGLRQMRQDLAKCWGCEAGRDKITVDPRGNIFPCAKFVDPGQRGHYVLGDVFRGFTNHIARREVCDPRQNIRGDCIDCSYGEYCAGGCLAVNLAMRGSIYRGNRVECEVLRTKVDLIRSHPALARAHRRQGVNVGPADCAENNV